MKRITKFDIYFKYKILYVSRNDNGDKIESRFIKALDIIEATKLACVDKEVWVISVSQED